MKILMCTILCVLLSLFSITVRAKCTRPTANFPQLSVNTTVDSDYLSKASVDTLLWTLTPITVLFTCLPDSRGAVDPSMSQPFSGYIPTVINGITVYMQSLDANDYIRIGFRMTINGKEVDVSKRYASILDTTNQHNYTVIYYPYITKGAGNVMSKNENISLTMPPVSLTFSDGTDGIAFNKGIDPVSALSIITSNIHNILTCSLSANPQTLDFGTVTTADLAAKNIPGKDFQLNMNCTGGNASVSSINVQDINQGNPPSHGSLLINTADISAVNQKNNTLADDVNFSLTSNATNPTASTDFPITIHASLNALKQKIKPQTISGGVKYTVDYN
ncbi:hypothetical protein GJV07_22895 [Enterobacteriaceae bacterium RIT711]|nr:hypothetical protein [Enterobacteriaceae bacterium RIT711]